MLALSIRQPYAELIPSTYSGQALRGIKTVEYRSRATRIVGERFFLYASKGGGDWLQHVFKLLVGEFAIAEDLTEQARADGFARVDGHRRYSTIAMPQAMVAAVCADDLEAELLQCADQLFAGDSFAARHQATCTC